MTRIKLLGVSLVAVIALAGFAAAFANAAEEKTKMLPEAGVSFTSTSKAGTLETVGKAKVTCTSDTDTGTIESANLGTFHVDFKGCKLGSNACNSVGDEKEVILFLGKFHFWLALETLNGTANTLVGALVFLVETFHFTCTVLGVNALQVVEGCVAALATPLNTLTLTTKDIFKQTSGVQLIIKVLPQEATSEISCELKTSIDEGAKEQSAIETEDESSAFTKEGKAITVLLMNPEAKE